MTETCIPLSKYNEALAERERVIENLFDALRAKSTQETIELVNLCERAVSERNHLDKSYQVLCIQFEKLLEYSRIPERTRSKLRI